jgi:hypothetical protein
MSKSYENQYRLGIQPASEICHSAKKIQLSDEEGRKKYAQKLYETQKNPFNLIKS